MKPKIIGAVILAVTAAVAGMILLFTDKSQITALDGYLGGEKIGLFEDEEIAEYIKKTYHLTFDYSRAGSLDMVTANLSGRNYLFPSSQTALEFYKEVHGSVCVDTTDPARSNSGNMFAALAKASRKDDEQLDIQKAAETATLTFTAEERQKIDEIKSELDLRESVTAVEFGIGCQRKLAEFADTVLDNSTKDGADVAGQLQALLGEIKSLDAGSAFKDTFWAKFPVIGSRARRMKKLKKGFSKARVRIELLEQQLERSRMELLRGSERFDMLGKESAKCFRELTMYIQAGTEQLAQMRENVVPKLRAEAQRQNDPMSQQLLYGFEENLNRFESRLHDLELSCTIALQSVPQMKIIQTGNSVMAQKIQSAVLNTIPIWKKRYAAAVGLSRQNVVYKTQREIDKITNAMIQQNAENLRQSAVQAAAESRHGIDTEALNKANESLIREIEQTLALNRESAVQHRQAQIELGRIENQLRNAFSQVR